MMPAIWKCSRRSGGRSRKFWGRKRRLGPMPGFATRRSSKPSPQEFFIKDGVNDQGERGMLSTHASRRAAQSIHSEFQEKHSKPSGLSVATRRQEIMRDG